MNPLLYLIPAVLVVVLGFVIYRQRARQPVIMIPDFLHKPGEKPAGHEEWVEVHFGKKEQ